MIKKHSPQMEVHLPQWRSRLAQGAARVVVVEVDPLVRCGPRNEVSDSAAANFWCIENRILWVFCPGRTHDRAHSPA